MPLKNILIYLLPLLASFLLAVFLTPLIKKLAWQLHIVDYPTPRKKHETPTALLGGLAVFFGFAIIMAVTYLLGWLDDGIIKDSQLLGILLGGLILITGGVLGDKYHLHP